MDTPTESKQFLFSQPHELTKRSSMLVKGIEQREKEESSPTKGFSDFEQAKQNLVQDMRSSLAP